MKRLTELEVAKIKARLPNMPSSIALALKWMTKEKSGFTINTERHFLWHTLILLEETNARHNT